jgi:hypothetical protein
LDQLTFRGTLVNRKTVRKRARIRKSQMMKRKDASSIFATLRLRSLI